VKVGVAAVGVLDDPPPPHALKSKPKHDVANRAGQLIRIFPKVKLTHLSIGILHSSSRAINPLHCSIARKQKARPKPDFFACANLWAFREPLIS
jgi:hypothetical protein